MARKTGGDRRQAHLADSGLRGGRAEAAVGDLRLARHYCSSSSIFPLALLAALRGGRARVHEKEEVK